MKKNKQQNRDKNSGRLFIKIFKSENLIAFSFDIGYDNVGATLAVARIVTGRGKPYPYDKRINVSGKCYKIQFDKYSCSFLIHHLTFLNH